MDFPSIFSKSKEWEWVFILSYDLYPISFFETEIINKLNVINNITVAIDYYNYKRMISDSEFDPCYMGIYYNLEPIKVKYGGKFHPKFYLFVSIDRVDIFIGSSNLTHSGFKKNYECMMSFSFTLENLDNDDVDFLIQIMDFLESSFLQPNNLIEPPNTLLRNTLAKILESSFFSGVKDLQAKTTGDHKRSYHFYANTQMSLLKQIENTFENNIDRLNVLSPYFDDDLTLLEDIQTKYKKINIYIPQKNSTFPINAYKNQGDELNNVYIYSTEKKDIIPRFIHAKAYRFISKNKIYDFVTSANFTKPGFYNDDYPRNFEIGVLFPSKGRFLDHASLDIKPIKSFDEIITDQKENQEKPTGNSSFDIESAFYDKGKIEITFEKSFIESEQIEEYEISLMLDGIEENRYSIIEQDGFYYFEPSMEIEWNQSIKIRLYSADPKYRSVPITVSREKHAPNLLPSLGSSAFAECVRTGGVEGLKKALDYAKHSGREDWLIYLLSHWNLKRIIEGIKDKDKEPGGEIDDIPSLPPRKGLGAPKKRLRENTPPVISSIDMRGNISDFIESLQKTRNSFEDFVNKYINYCFPFLLEINAYFKKILEREENKKELNPSIRYPEYTWLNNYKQLFAYIFVSYEKIKSHLFTDNIKMITNNLKYRLSTYILLWIHLNTEKTINEFRSNKFFCQFEDDVKNLFLVASNHVDQEIHNNIEEIFGEYGLSTGILQSFSD